ncbi:MAG: NAD-dependent epimerase/dehydratase family protein [Thaumarchaeota archaeon]|nr:NAD-dependent epimerase/dehydratase family protein [Nitrososphaerota archaeon]
MLGSTGSLGSAVVNELTSSGRPVRALVRSPAKASTVFASPDKVDMVEGSVEDAGTLEKAFDGVEVFHNCVNAPYSRWSTLPEMHRGITNAAGKAKARMVFPGNVYIYGHCGTEKVGENHPRNPCSEKGRIRLGLEGDFMRLSREGSVPCAIMRFPDYYGPNAASVADGIFRSALKNKRARWYGKLDAIHEFIFISDAAKAMVAASERPDASSQDFNVPGPEPIRVRDFIARVYAQMGFEAKMTGTSRFFVQIAGLFNSTARAFAEMQYLTEEPLILDGSKFEDFFGMKYPARSYEDGIRDTLAWLRKSRPAAT